MGGSDFYKINSPGVVYESFDDEVVVINLESGNYYSFNLTGAKIWDLIIKGFNSHAIIKVLQSSYSDDQKTVESSVNAFLQDLLSNEILIHSDNPPPGVMENPNPEKTNEKTQPFEPPLLQTYTDMQELLLLDPIHEVDETGWPSRTKKQVN
jgi:hypothetical protein